MAALCEFPGCKSYSRTGKYCIGHARIFGDKPAPSKHLPIAKQSDKEKDIKKQLKKKYKVFLSQPENLLCAIKSPECTKLATCVNHTNGRGANVLNEEDWEPSCEHCNNYIEEHHQWAKERGHKKQRHKKGNIIQK